MKVKRLLKRAVNFAGLEVRRRPDPMLPFVHEIVCDGSHFKLWIANQHAKRWWHKPELQLNAELRALRSMCTPGAVVLDVGAHHGLQTVLCARWVGARGYVHAFEANAENAVVLSANMALNHVWNCTCVHAVVGAAVGSAYMVGETVAQLGGESRKVDRLSLDDYCTTLGITGVDVLKIDVEGFEGEVLRGARQILTTRPRMDIELHLDDLARYGDSATEIFQLLDIRRYRVMMMARPDWEGVVQIRTADDLPSSGVVNLFMWPLSQAGSHVPEG